MSLKLTLTDFKFWFKYHFLTFLNRNCNISVIVVTLTFEFTVWNDLVLRKRNLIRSNAFFLLILLRIVRYSFKFSSYFKLWFWPKNLTSWNSAWNVILLVAAWSFKITFRDDLVLSWSEFLWNWRILVSLKIV